MGRFTMVLALIAILGAGCSQRTATENTPRESATPKLVSKVSSSGTSFPGRLRVGRSGTIKIPLANSGTGVAKEIEFMTNKEFGDAWIVSSSEPKWNSNRADGDRRFLKFDGLEPGEKFTYMLDVTAKAPGEHEFKITLSVDGNYVTTYSGRAVVLP